MFRSAYLAIAIACALTACGALTGLKNGKLGMNGGGAPSGGESPAAQPASAGGEGAGTSESEGEGTSESGAQPASAGAKVADTAEGRQAQEDKEYDAKCGAATAEFVGQIDEIGTSVPQDADAAKALADRWEGLEHKNFDLECHSPCNWMSESAAEARKPLCEKSNDRRAAAFVTPIDDHLLDKYRGPLQLRVVRGAMGTDPKWARNYMFAMYRTDDHEASEDLRKLGRDVAKFYDAELATMFKASGGLGIKDNGDVMCVYSRSRLPAGGRGDGGFTTHFDGPGVIYVGCRIAGPVNAQNGKILMDVNADQGSGEALLHEVALGQADALGDTDWVTSKFTLPAGGAFTKTMHYTFDVQIIVRNIWNEESTLSTSVFTWHM